LRIDLITLFPEFFEPWLTTGVCSRAISSQQMDVHRWNPRQFTTDVHQSVDDRPYGGGPGMVMMPTVLAQAVTAVKASCQQAGLLPGPVVLFSPAGRRLDQAWVERQLGPESSAQFTLICGRYEGLDQRFIDRYVDLELSLGDFVLSGGEIPALAVLDALARRLPGVLGDMASAEQDSFMNGLLDHPHYTRPEIFEEIRVPEVLLSGHHGKISDWRLKQAQQLTAARRPDLYQAYLQASEHRSQQEACAPESRPPKKS
jgi:tRNA (guanine37-N1)-methyltransferase